MCVLRQFATKNSVQYPFCTSDESQVLVIYGDIFNIIIIGLENMILDGVNTLSFSTPSSFSLTHSSFFVFLLNEHKLTNESDLTGS